MKYVLSLGINDYRNCSGGTNKVILAHQKMFKEYGYGYIYVCPLSKKKNTMWEIIINNRYKGVKKTKQLLYFLFEICKGNNSILGIHIHHLIGASLREVDELLSKLNVDIKYYIHDFFSICPSVKLLKDNMVWCGSEQMSAEKCGKCIHYETGKEQNYDLRELIKKYKERITFVAPSNSAKELWVRAYEEYQDRVLVINHQQLQGTYNKNKETIKDKIRVGYLGEQVYSKGWDTWRQIMNTTDDDRYEYYYFGKAKDYIKRLTNIKVDFRKNIDAMINALRKNPIDCVVLWSIWGETYSYTYYESLASNVFVITNNISGNIAKQVEERKNGIVLRDENELINLFSNYELLCKCINEYKLNGKAGPENLLENPEIILYINEHKDTKIVQVEKCASTMEEVLNSFFYGILQIAYWVKRRML